MNPAAAAEEPKSPRSVDREELRMTTTRKAAREAPAAGARNLTKVYGRGEAEVHALRGIDLDLPRGRFTAIMGPSGSGKSTLMHCLAGLDQATAGSVTVAGTELGSLDDDALTIFRREHIGFVFQSFNLLPMLTAEQNILLPLELGGRRLDPAARERARMLAETLGVADRLGRRPAEMRRPAAAGRHRAGSDHRAGAPVRRRADRKPRQRHVGRGAGAPAPVGPRTRPDRRDGHPRARRVGVRRRRGHPAGRAGRLMWTVLLASLRTHARRYVAAAIAVAVGAAFVVVTGVLSAGGRSAVMDGFGAPYRNADHVVSDVDRDAAIALAERLGDRAAAIGRVMLPVHAGGRLSAETAVGPIAPSPELRWQRLSSGRFPARTGEAVVDVPFAQAQSIAVGDRIQIGSGADAAGVRVVVARDGGSFARADPGTIRLDPGAFRKDFGLRADDRVTVRVGDRHARLRVALGAGWGKAGLVAPDTLAALSASSRPYAVWVRASAGTGWNHLGGDLDGLANPIGAEVENGLWERSTVEQELTIVTWSVIGLLAIAVVVSLIGIANTLGLSVLERIRENALLRALGLTRRQLRRMPATEAMLLAVVAALLGTAVGVGFAWVGYRTFVRQILAHATMRVPWPSLLVVVLAAALAALLASVLPARRAARVTPAAGLSSE
jgi:RecA/RadA recombinase